MQRARYLKNQKKIQSLKRKPLADVNNGPNVLSSLNWSNRVHFVNPIKQIFENMYNSKTLEFLQDLNPSIQDCCRAFFNKTFLNDIEMIEKNTKNNLQTWKNERRFRITGSRCKDIFSYKKGEWYKKSIYYFWPASFSSKYTEHGLKYESTARTIYCQQTKHFVHECGFLVHPKESCFGYSPDGVVMIQNKPSILLEIKCPFELKDTSDKTLLQKCKTWLHILNGNLALRKTHKYYFQIQFGMAILNLSECDFVIYASCNNTIRIIRVAIDLEFVKNLFIKIKQVFFNSMLHVACTPNQL